MSQQLNQKLDKLSPEKRSLWTMRHSAEHVLMMAMRNLGYEHLMAMGPATDDGFYFDFEMLKGGVSEDDFIKIEKEMHRIIDQDMAFVREEISAAEARQMFPLNPYKQEWIAEAESRGEKITIYRTGDKSDQASFVDLCAGPHVESTGKIGAIKLLSVAGAYWRGSEKNKMLTRLYGTAFATTKELEEYLLQIEEAKKRDHKKLGKELDLFFIDEEVGQGLPLWTPKGTTIKHELEQFTRDLEQKYGYSHVETPYLGSEKLYKTSGHLDHYQENMYHPIDMDGDVFYLRPMACPHHIKIYQHKPRSYRDLPIRYAEIADYNRYEKSGELMGLIRVRKFQLTDGHLFVRPDQLKHEFMQTCRMIEESLTTLGIIGSITYRYSKHDPLDQLKYYPDPELWNKSETIMKEALNELGFDYYEAVGEAAFYGPKLDVQIKNVNGKEDTIFTAQIDFLLPEKFNLEYIDENSQKQRPVMLHRSAIGCLERTFAYLIEHFAGAFPVWLHPVQTVIIPISQDQNEYAQKIKDQLKEQLPKLRIEIDDSNETLQKKIRHAQEEKNPYMLIVGKKELENSNLSVRLRTEENLGVMSINDFADRVERIIKSKSLEL